MQSAAFQGDTFGACLKLQAKASLATADHGLLAFTVTFKLKS